MSSPFREQRLSPREVRRVLRRAAELAERDPATTQAERALTRHELETSASELGLPTSAVAAALDAPAAESAPETSGGRLLGAPMRIAFTTEVDGEPSESDREDLLEEVREVLGDTGSIETIGKTLIWKLVPVSGRGRDVSVRLRSRDGRTRMVVEERLGRLATALFVGLGVGGGIGPMGGYIAAVAQLGPIGLVLPLLWIPLMLLVARAIFTAAVVRRRRTLSDLSDRLVASASRWSTTSDAGRVRVSTDSAGRLGESARNETTDEAEADEAARADEDAGAAAVRRLPHGR